MSCRTGSECSSSWRRAVVVPPRLLLVDDVADRFGLGSETKAGKSARRASRAINECGVLLGGRRPRRRRAGTTRYGDCTAADCSSSPITPTPTVGRWRRRDPPATTGQPRRCVPEARASRCLRQRDLVKHYTVGRENRGAQSTASRCRSSPVSSSLCTGRAGSGKSTAARPDRRIPSPRRRTGDRGRSRHCDLLGEGARALPAATRRHCRRSQRTDAGGNEHAKKRCAQALAHQSAGMRCKRSSRCSQSLALPSAWTSRQTSCRWGERQRVMIARAPLRDRTAARARRRADGQPRYAGAAARSSNCSATCAPSRGHGAATSRRTIPKQSPFADCALRNCRTGACNEYRP